MVANCFADLFSNKIDKIHQGLGDLRASVGPTPYVDDICSAELGEFNEITEEDVKRRHLHVNRCLNPVNLTQYF